MRTMLCHGIHPPEAQQGGPIQIAQPARPQGRTPHGPNRERLSRGSGLTYPTTPDGRYFVVRGRLWRCSNPALDDATRRALTRELMSARSAKGAAMRQGDATAVEAARQRVDAAKHGLGERGAPWWTDGAPDYNRRMARATPYADWFAALPALASPAAAGEG